MVKTIKTKKNNKHCTISPYNNNNNIVVVQGEFTQITEEKGENVSQLPLALPHNLNSLIYVKYKVFEFCLSVWNFSTEVTVPMIVCSMDYQFYLE